MDCWYLVTVQAILLDPAVVKAVVIALGTQMKRSEFGAVYGKLYRKFGITSYKLMPASCGLTRNTITLPQLPAAATLYCIPMLPPPSPGAKPLITSLSAAGAAPVHYSLCQAGRNGCDGVSLLVDRRSLASI